MELARYECKPAWEGVEPARYECEPAWEGIEPARYECEPAREDMGGFGIGGSKGVLGVGTLRFSFCQSLPFDLCLGGDLDAFASIGRQALFASLIF